MLGSNCRHLSLACMVHKYLEKLVREHIIGYMKENNLFNKKQYGFITGSLTTLQPLTV